MKKKWVFIPVYIIVVLGIILGSIYDLQIAQNVYSIRNGFGVFIASIGEFPCYCGFAFLGGMLLNLELKNDKVMWRKITLISLGAIASIVGAYLLSTAIISRNAWNIEKKWYVGYPIGFGLAIITYLVGFLFAKHSDNANWRRDLIAMVIAMVSALIIVTIAKWIAPRPRYRWLVGETSGSFVSSTDYFHNWWDSASSLKKEVLGVDAGISEEFKSFPSGHTTSAFAGIIILSYLPRFKTSWIRYQNLFFFAGLLWALLVAYSRMLIGAHFLTDVSFGGLITISCFLVMDLIVGAIEKRKSLEAKPQE